MPIRVAINGFGRIGRLVYRAGMRNSRLEFVAVNDLADARTLAHLLKYDSIHGKLSDEIKVEDSRIVINGKSLEVLKQKELEGLPWKKMGIDVVVESSGRFTDKESASVHLKDGAKKVLISAPAKGADATIVLGVNDNSYDIKKHNVLSIGSCTTNCLAPLVKIINDNFGIQKGFMTTIHAYTNDQTTLDQVHKDLRRARAANLSIIPTTTGAAKAISLVLPELEGKMDGVAIRVPVPAGSIVDLACLVNKDTSVAEVNKAFLDAANGSMKRYLEYTTDPIVSADIVGNPHSAIFDSLSTMVMGKNLVKVFGWYDNEWGFSCRMVDMLERIMGD